MTRGIDYGNLMYDAMRGLLHKVLLDVAANGLPGDHHFFITFQTSHPDAELADWLSDRYPDEMVVVIQHEFEDLKVTDDGFFVTVRFGGAPETIYVPYRAITTFVDPSVELGLQFQQRDEEIDEADTDTELTQTDEAELEVADSGPRDAEIVSLDSFRK
ncbi:hypothetical protein C1J03_10635 [Sulfitobacter sp. SK012]|uniref:SspB family protein n=1 Tax=Sulfitobacter sp. SK012 TaxID=1389005 RepID=UPI000E0B9FD1|nr:ClpXP protease specificity-enhancing factor SspB [Sulfitobacter sp. SK012]AXI46441.1 hypothetical protein C1J03_10635 [Sulfitobacter sp. SK012]